MRLIEQMNTPGKRDGWKWELVPLTFNRARMTHTDPSGDFYDDFY